MSLILNVGGEWDFCFDSTDEGVSKSWFLQKPKDTHKVTLPHVWSMEPTPTEPSPVGFYFKKFMVDEKESAKRFFIRFDSIHHHATIWLNGLEIGSHMGGHVSFDLDASKMVIIGEENTLTIRVQTPNERGALNEYSASDLPLGYPYKKGHFAGILGDIHFLMGGRAGIQYLTCHPDYEAEWVTIETKFWNPKNYKAELEYTITSPKGKKDTLPKLIKLDKENGTHSITFSLQDAQIWSLDEPNLYTIQVSLGGSYAVECRFGLRRVEVERCSIKLNHQFIKLRGVNYSQLFPFHKAVPAHPIDKKKELLSIKEAGFNAIRSCGAPLNNQILDICDQIGLLVIQETTCYDQRSNKDTLEGLKDQILSLTSHTGHHPSIIIWAIGAENGSMVLENGNKLLRFTSQLDPYRPIVSNLNSVYLDSMGKGKIDLGKVYDPTEGKIDSYESHKIKVPYPISTRTQNLLVNYCTSQDAKNINDGLMGAKSFWERYNYLKEELGGKVLVDGLGTPVMTHIDKTLSHSITKNFPDDPEVQNLVEFKSQLKKVIKDIPVWKNIQEFYTQAEEICYQGLAHQIDSYLINTQFSGYFFESWADHGLNTKGLVDWFRNPKPTLALMKKLNQRIKIMSQAEARTPYMGTSAAMNIHILNEEGLGEYGLLVRVKGPNGRIWHQESMPGTADRGVNSLGRFKFPVGFEKGWFTFDLTLSQGKKEIAKREELFYVPPKVELDSVLGAVHFIGDFSDSITYASDKDSELMIINKLHTLKPEKINSYFEKVSQGATLVLGCLTSEDTEIINKLKLSETNITCFRSSWEENGSFHYALDSEYFKDLPNNKILNQAYSDLLPHWSISNSKEIESYAGSINLLRGSLGKEKVKHGIDMGSLSYGQGRIIFNQYRIFDQLGVNALADALFFNLVNHLKK